METNKKRLKRQYLIDANKTIPKQSRRKWLENEIVSPATGVESQASNESETTCQASASAVHHDILFVNSKDCSLSLRSLGADCNSFRPNDASVHNADAVDSNKHTNLENDSCDDNGCEIESEDECYAAYSSQAGVILSFVRTYTCALFTVQH